MYRETINEEDAIQLFESLMQSDSQMRVLFLQGAPKMGKSHLLSKVFYILASKKYNAHCVNIDLRRQPVAIRDILHAGCQDLGENLCTSYLAASQGKIRYPDAESVVKKTIALGSTIVVTAASKDNGNNFQQTNFDLTTHFVSDVKRICNGNRLVIFFIDNVNHADDSTKGWLMDAFLKQLTKLLGVRIVLAGQSLPEANLGYLTLCERHSLLEIREIESYITYCKSTNIKISHEETIRVLAVLSDHIPGLFIENMLKIRLAGLA